MNIKPTKIVVIHDGLIPKVDPLLIALTEEFAEEHVIHLEQSRDGLNYVLNHLNQRMVVLLDRNFTHGESGMQVFSEIRANTSLVHIILITADPLSDIDNDELIELINHDAFAVANVTDEIPKIVSFTKTAVHKLDVQVASVMEQWISEQSEGTKKTPYVKDSDGTTYTLLQVSEEIRKRTDFGRRMEKNILLLAIDLFVQGERYVDDQPQNSV